ANPLRAIERHGGPPRGGLPSIVDQSRPACRGRLATPDPRDAGGYNAGAARSPQRHRARRERAFARTGDHGGDELDGRRRPRMRRWGARSGPAASTAPLGGVIVNEGQSGAKHLRVWRPAAVVLLSIAIASCAALARPAPSRYQQVTRAEVLRQTTVP